MSAQLRKFPSYHKYQSLSSGALIKRVDPETWLLDSGERVRVSTSCLVQPALGDQVMWFCSPKGNYIVAILSREQDSPLVLGQQDEELIVHSRKTQIIATEKIHLSSAKDCEINAVAGELEITAKKMATRIMTEWIQLVKTNICQYGDWIGNVKSLLKFHSERQQLTAAKEVKVDADIIHMG